MKRARFSEEQIIEVLKEAEAGAKVSELCRRHGISDATFYTWRSKYISSYAASGSYGGYSSENLAQYTDAWGELDGQITYNIIGDKFQAVFSAQNLLDKVVKPYTTGSAPLGWSKFGTRLSLGVTYRLN